MIIDDENKIIFIHIPKNAGSAITNSLKLIGGAQSKILNKHAPGFMIKEKLTKEFNTYFKFAFVRNPWDRLYSQYRYFKKINYIPQEPSFKEWLFDRTITPGCRYQTPIVPIQQKQQLHWITDNQGKIIIDYIGRFETLIKDYSVICQKFNIPRPLEIVNETPGEYYKDVYDDESNKFIETYFKDDIEMFGYEF